MISVYQQCKSNGIVISITYGDEWDSIYYDYCVPECVLSLDKSDVIIIGVTQTYTSVIENRCAIL